MNPDDECGLTNLGGCASSLASDALSGMAKSFADSAGWAVKNMTTVWLGTPSPELGAGSTAAWLSDRMVYFVLVAALVSVLWAAYQLATSGAFEHGAELGKSLARLIIVTGVTATATTIALEVGDAVAAWVLDQADVKLNVAGLIALVNVTPGVAMILALVVILAQVIQAVLMLVKNAMIVLLVGFLPLTAGATNTPLGRAGFHKALTWLGGFLLYKPVAAIIYAVSFKLSDRDNSIAGQLSGISLMLLAIFALPALMRFLVPVTAAATGGNAGALSGAAVGAAVATGAVVAAGAATGGAGFAAAPAAMSAAPSGAAAGGTPAAVGADTTSSNSSNDSEATV